MKDKLGGKIMKEFIGLRPKGTATKLEKKTNLRNVRV